MAKGKERRRGVSFDPEFDDTFYKKYPVGTAVAGSLLVAIGGYSYYSSAKIRVSKFLKMNADNADGVASNCIDGLDDDVHTGLPCTGNRQVEPQFEVADRGWFEDGSEMVMAFGALSIVVGFVFIALATRVFVKRGHMQGV